MPNGHVNKNYDISVIIAAFNCEDTLERAVHSVLEQEGITFEILIIDDASEDKTLEIAHAFEACEASVKVFALEKNSGPAHARNIGLNCARGDYITLLDSDDFMLAGRLSKLFHYAQTMAYDVVADDLFKADAAHLDAPFQRLLEGTILPITDLTFNAFILGNISKNTSYRGEMGFLKPLIKREFIEGHHIRYIETLRLGEDYAFYGALLLNGARFCIVKPYGYVAVIRPHSLSAQHSANDLKALSQIDWEWLANDSLTKKNHTAVYAHYIDTLKRYKWLQLIEAVKARSLTDILKSFNAPYPVGVDLIKQLICQFFIRGRRLLFQSRL